MKRDAKQVLTELLVLKAQGGDEAAFAQLYETWAKDVLRLVRFVVKEMQPAEEIAQETWISAAKGLRRLDDPAAFCSWLFRIARRRGVDWVRKSMTERKKCEAFKAEANLMDHASNVERSVNVDLVEEIHKLDTDSRLLLHLFYETGLSVAEVATAMDLRAGTVKSRLFAVRETLRLKLERKMT